MRRFDERRTLDHIAGEIDEALADALGRAVAAAHAKTPAVEAQAWIAALGSYIDEHVEAFRQLSGYFSRRRSRFARAPPAAPPMSASSRSCSERGRQRFRPPHSRRPSSRQHRADRRPAGSVRRHRVQRHHRLRRRVLRPRFPAHGPARARAGCGRQYRAQPLSCETRRVEDLDALAALPFFLSMRAAIRAEVTARADGAGESDTERASIARHGARLFRLRACARSRRRRRNSSPSAASPAPGNPNLRGCWRPKSSRCPVPSIVRSDVERKALFGVGETEKLPADAYTDEVTARVYAALADKARRIVAAGHSVIVDAVFAQAAGARGHRRQRQNPRIAPCGGCSSPQTSRPGSAGSAPARAMPPMPTRPWRRRRSATTSARSIGRRSTPPERPKPPWRGQRPHSRHALID